MRLPWREQPQFEDVFDDLTARPTARVMRRWSEQKLHCALTSGELWPSELSTAQSILREKESWRGPGRWALLVPVFALCVSAAALFS